MGAIPMFLPVLAAFYGGNIRQDPASVVDWQEFEVLERVIGNHLPLVPISWNPSASTASTAERSRRLWAATISISFAISCTRVPCRSCGCVSCYGRAPLRASSNAPCTGSTEAAVGKTWEHSLRRLLQKTSRTSSQLLKTPPDTATGMVPALSNN